MFSRRKPVCLFRAMCESSLAMNLSIAFSCAVAILQRETKWLNENIFSNRKVPTDLPSDELANEHLISIIPNASVLEKAGMLELLHTAMYTETYFDMSNAAIKYLTHLACFLRETMVNVHHREEYRVASWVCSVNIVRVYLREKIWSLKIDVSELLVRDVAIIWELRVMNVVRALEATIPPKSEQRLDR